MSSDLHTLPPRGVLGIGHKGIIVARSESLTDPFRLRGLLDLVGLAAVMELTPGRSDVVVGLIDGPVVLDHPDLASTDVRSLGQAAASCGQAGGTACRHGTFIAGMLFGQRGRSAPAICPGCSFVLRPIFAEAGGNSGGLPAATPAELAEALTACIEAGARVINLSAAPGAPSVRQRRELVDVLNYAASQRVLVVTAAGNQAAVGGSVLTRHPWVIPVAGCTPAGQPMRQSNLSFAIARGGLAAPGSGVTSLSPEGSTTASISGTSVAAPFVTGAIALLYSQFPRATAEELRFHLVNVSGRRGGIVPPLLNAWTSYQALKH